MGPVVKRIARTHVHDGRPRFELIVIAGVSGDKFLVYTRASHRAPLVMVAAEPKLRYVFRRFVSIYFLG